jgi:threonine synthase
MKYYSTNNRTLKKTLKEAVIQGLAEDNGLFMPEIIPVLEKSLLRNMQKMDFREISLIIAKNLFGTDIPISDLERITLDAINFDTPLVHIHDSIYALELFHGPTFAFKDVGARFMARLLGYFIKEYTREVNVLVATSGDTGSAVANGFWKVPGIRVHILYPKGLVSTIQEHQFTTLGENISALEIAGNFDDCQRLVKTAFLDHELNSRLTLTSANSINIARLLPQTFYYFNGYAKLGSPSQDLVISVPSGNYGNLTAAIIAGNMGLPFKKFIAATNINDVVPEYLQTGKFKPRPSKATIANAMDVGNPSNFDRILDLYGHSHSKIIKAITGYSFTDNQIREIIGRIYKKFNYLLDPHGATGYQALVDYSHNFASLTGFFIETAHPAKFADIVDGVIGKKIEIPFSLQESMNKTPIKVKLSSDYKDLRDYLFAI